MELKAGESTITFNVNVEGLEEAKASAEGLVQAIEKAISLAGELATIVSNLEVKVDVPTFGKVVRSAIRDNRAASQSKGDGTEQP